MFRTQIYTIFLCLGMVGGIQAQQLWTKDLGSIPLDAPLTFYTLEVPPIKGSIASQNKSPIVLEFPNEKGELEAFELQEQPVLSSKLQKQHPWIRTFVGKSLTRKQVRIRVSQSRKGYWSWIQTPEVNYFIQPSKKYPGKHLSYAREARETSVFRCKTPLSKLQKYAGSTSIKPQKVLNNRLRTFRIAIATTGEYGQYWADDNPSNGSPEEDVLAEIVRSVHRINEVFETDLQVHLELVSGTELISTDPVSDYFNGNTSLNTQIQTYLDTQIGDSNYDVGHLLDYNSPNGNAGDIGSVCRSGVKGSAFSAHDFRDAYNIEYLTDYFDLDFFGHELGHQFGGTHTFGFSFESAGSNMEPGSGSTIMAYAGITGTDDVQNHGDAYFHYKNIQQINDYLDRQSCYASGDAFTNSAPIITPLTDVTIPQGTAYKLQATVTDPEAADVLYYCWEQLDNGRVRRQDFGPTKLTGAMARSRPPSVNSFRYVPEMPSILQGNLTQTNPTRGSRWETVSQIGRPLNWGLTVRDRLAMDVDLQGRLTQAAFEITVDENSGPFQVISQSSPTLWEGGQWTTVLWEVAGTNIAPVNAAYVQILLSTDGGQSFPHVLASQTPNDGEAQVIIPLGLSSQQARILIEPIDNIFVAVNSRDIQLRRKDIALRLQSASLEICSNASNQIPFELSRLPGIQGNINLNLTQVPEGLSISLPQTAFSSAQSSGVLVLDNLATAPPGDYTIEVRASLDSQNTPETSVDATIQLNLRSTTINPPVLSAPEPAAQNQLAETQLRWIADPNASSYRVEVSSVQDFSSLTYSATTQQNRLTTMALGSDAEYYWRVKALNLCGESPFSEVRSFRTQTVSCETYAAENLPQDITDATSEIRGVTRIEILVSNNLPILDLDVLVDINHTWLEDLALVLISPSGQRVQLTNRIGENQDNYRRTRFDQEATTEILSASPPYTGRFQPQGDLSLLYNSNSGGTWILEIIDHEAQDVGSLQQAELYFCFDGVPAPNSDLDVIPDETDNCPNITNPDQADSDGNGIGNLCDLYDPQNLTLQKLDATCVAKNNGAIRISARAQFEYTARLEGTATNLTRSFENNSVAFNNLSPGNYRICVTSSADSDFEYCYQAVISEPEALSVQAQLNHENKLLSLELKGGKHYRVQVADQLYEVQKSGTWTTALPEEWTQVVVTTDLNCQGTFRQWVGPEAKPVLAPNPAQEYVDILLPEASSYQLRMLTTDGIILHQQSLEINRREGGSYRFTLESFAPGVYVIQIQGPKVGHTFKLIKK